MATTLQTTIVVDGLDLRSSPAVVKAPETSISSSDDQSSATVWPYEAGFQTEEEQRTPVELKVTGSIPAYAAGVLYRTGPSDYRLKKDDGSMFKASHWFDGFNQVHRFQIIDEGDAVKVFYNSRRTVDECIEHVRKTGEFNNITFGQKKDPCQSFFKKMMSTYKTATQARADLETHNIGVTISTNLPGINPQEKLTHGSGIQALTTKTDAALYQKLDPETLEPQGVCRQTVLHPDLKGPMSASHAKTCPKTGDFFNYNLELGRKATYRIFQTSVSTGKTTILATFEGIPAYMHSLFLTQSTVVLCVWNAHYTKAGLSLLLNKNILDSIAPVDPKIPATWYVIDRTPAQRGILATYTSPAFFAFHSINAFEQPSSDSSGTDIIADVPTYPDLSVLHRFYYENLLPSDPSRPSYSSKTPACRARLHRYKLPLVPLGADSRPANANANANKPRPVELVFALDPLVSPELPTLNPRYTTLPYRYTYGVADGGRSAWHDGLVKVDLHARTTAKWEVFGQTPGEPIFVPRPREEGRELDEDEGVLLSVVLDGLEGRSYLLCLDAKTLAEVGRAQVEGVVGFGFHGVHFPEGKRDAYHGGD